jgi:hypothetical protein
MSDDIANDALRDLRAELDAVTPSPAFAASVRARVVEESRGSRWGVATWIVPLGLAAAAVAIVAVAWRSSPPPVVADPPATPHAEAVAEPATPIAPPATASTARLARSSTARRTSAAVRSQAAAPVRSTEPTLEVITNQGEVLRAIWARVRGPLSAESAPDAPQPAAGVVGEIPIAPIPLDPIVVRTIDPTGSGGGSTVIRRVADATRSER